MRIFTKPWYYILYVLVILVCLRSFVFDWVVKINDQVSILKWDSVQKFYSQLSKVDRFELKLYTTYRGIKLNDIKPWKYDFEKQTSIKKLISKLKDGPDQKYLHLTLLEGRSKYDIDSFLQEKGYINKGEYIDYVGNEKYISRYQQSFEFLENSQADSQLKSLEGFLYPETYFVDPQKDIVDQLVYSQLKTFKNKIYSKYLTGGKIDELNSRLRKDNFSKIQMDLYKVLKLASIIEKEESNNKNKDLIAGIFLNRLEKGMKLGADISLCYGLKESYDNCDVKTIVQNLDDKSNKHNTRERHWLPPSPIANPSLSSIQAVLNYRHTDYYYYLHDRQGRIHPSKNIQGHNFKKSKY